MTKSNSALRIPPSAFWSIAIAFVYLAGLTMPLLGPDEPRFSQVAREMFERGDWITPTLGGFHWFEKPPLLYWVQIISYNIFGVSEFAARFGSAIFGLATVLSLWILGRHVGRNAAGSDQSSTITFADLLALTAASTIGIIAFSHGASFDIILTFPITAAMVSFFIYDSSRNTISLVAFYFFVGLALLAKGLVGIIFPLAIVGFYHVISWRFPDRRLLVSFAWGTLLAIGVAALWYLPMYLRHGYDFVDHFFIQHHFQRFTSNKYLHPQPFYFFLWVLPLMTIPWLPFFLAAIWDFGKSIFSEDAGRDSIERRLRIFCIAWIVVPLAFFSFSGSKLPGYILPVVPGAIILAADYILSFIENSRLRRYAIYAVAAITLLITGVAAVAIAPRFAQGDSVKHLFEKAADRGFGAPPVIMLHGISYNAEFYATRQIVRDVDGKPKRFPGTKEVSEEVRSSGAGRALVIVPVEYLSEVLKSDYVRSELIGDNGEVALVAVESK